MTPVIRAEEGSKMMLVIEIKCGFKNEGSARGKRGVEDDAVTRVQGRDRKRRL